MHRSCWLLSVWVIPIITIVESSWGEPGSSQYHIQTDEGPERYFRFQTDNGQFRKEKRLQDGTVIGTEAWIDAAGFLRQKDYIADKDGYRILKSKTVFVGEGRQIEDAIKSTKSISSASNHLIRHGVSGYATSTASPSLLTHTAEAKGNEETRSPFYFTAEAAKVQPSPYLGFDHYPDEISKLDSSNENNVNNIQYQKHPTAPVLPSLTINPPFESRYRRIKPIAIAPTRPTPIVVNDVELPFKGSSTPTPFTARTIENTEVAQGYLYTPPTAHTYSNGETGLQYPSSTSAPPRDALDALGLDGLLPPLPPPKSQRRLRPQPIQANLGNTIEEYAANGLVPKGFSYFLPHQYHEEEQLDAQKRAGSFGYVDPFGIRRVVYYNASPERGFVHRNKNRYVGLDAVPYNQPSN